MARYLTLTLARSIIPTKPLSILPLFAHRSFSSSSSAFNTHPIDFEIDSSPTPAGEVEVLALKKLEDAMHNIMVRQSVPDWLPFRPGYSYWVPPKPRASGDLVNLVNKIASPLTEEETLSFTTLRGWPDSDFYLRDQSPYTFSPHGNANSVNSFAPSDPASIEAEFSMYASYHAFMNSGNEDDE